MDFLHEPPHLEIMCHRHHHYRSRDCSRRKDDDDHDDDILTYFWLNIPFLIVDDDDELQDPIIKTEPGPASRLPLLGPPHGGPYQTSSTSSSASPRIERKELIWSLSAASARQVIPINESPPPPSPMTWIRHHQDDDGDDDHQNKPIIPITI
ncbi:hypothetical protein Fcan01_03973 [Folsomia candida]|uniref:Uncharacterized protein n=1 Tax=Folsomia candida TaxID=158441 RepID=A0A226EUJ2_FOLCA|nr:hypothetical protein Fcan01_03973 [Folsomia candida]